VQVDRALVQGLERGRQRPHAELAEVVTEQHRHLGVVRIAERMGLGVAAQRDQRGALAAHSLHDLLQAAQRRRQYLLRAGRLVGRGGQQLQGGCEGARVRPAERGPVDQHEVLRHIGFGAGQAFARDADHLQGHAARRGDVVGQQVAGHRRQPHHQRQGAGPREDALGQFGRQAGGDPELAHQQAVALGVHAADGLAAVGKGLFLDLVHRLVDGRLRSRLVRRGMLESGREAQRCDGRRHERG
jgi:hypothetical protein